MDILKACLAIIAVMASLSAGGAIMYLTWFWCDDHFGHTIQDRANKIAVNMDRNRNIR